MALPQIPGQTSEKRLKMGKAYTNQIEVIKSQRHELVEKWRKALDHYEGKVVETDWPWPKASKAHLPVVATHSDAIYARLYNTATGQDPIFQIEDVAADPAEPITNTELTRAFQLISTNLEQGAINLKDALATALTITVKYGDSIVYVPWLTKTVYDYNLNLAGDEWVKDPDGRELYGRPDLKVLHPENFYIPTHEYGPNAIQNSKFVAFDFEIDYNDIALYEASGEYTKEEAKQLKELLRPTKKKDDYFKDTGDTRSTGYGDRDSLDVERRRNTGLDEEVSTGKLRMYHVWAREDLDGDGYEEEIQFHVHSKTGIIPHITYNPYEHKKRPFVRFAYQDRDGQFYSQGIPEMLNNIQDVMDQVMRDILDNNKVQNTKVFLASKGSGIDPEMKVFPSRIVFVPNIDTDFRPIDLGSGKQITSIEDLGIVQQWSERRTGITDFNLGQERTSRTPATTTLTLLEEANKRIDYVIRRMRMSMEELWMQVLALYAQYGFSEDTLDVLLGQERADELQASLSNISTKDIIERVRFTARVSTQNLNRAVRRQEAVTEYGQMKDYYEQAMALAGALQQQDMDPNVREILLSIGRGYRRVITRFLDTFDEKNQDEINPDLEKLFKRVEGGFGSGLPSFEEGDTGAGGAMAEALSSLGLSGGNSGGINPPGRPVTGQARVQGASPEERNLA